SLLSPDYQGTHDRVLRGVPDGHSPACRPEKSQRPDSRISEDPQRASFETAFSDWFEVLLLRLGRRGAIRRLRKCRFPSKASCIPTRWNSSGASLSCSTRSSPDWWPAHLSWLLWSGCSGSKK